MQQFCQSFPIVDEQVHEAIGDVLYELFMVRFYVFSNLLIHIWLDVGEIVWCIICDLGTYFSYPLSFSPIVHAVIYRFYLFVFSFYASVIVASIFSQHLQFPS